MKKTFFALMALTAFGVSAQTVTPMWLRDVKISPDGKEIAFTYKGDIYKVPSTGGMAVRLTSQPSYESVPIWSPDGKSIAFASDRNGGSDIFIMPSTGGAATRLTFNSASEVPEAFSPDGKNVLFSAAIQDPATSAAFPSGRLTELYQVPVSGGKTTQVIGIPANMVNFTPGGNAFLYEDIKGLEDRFRKHHTSSVTSDIWMYDIKTGKHVNLTDRPGEDRNPVVSPDGKTVYILSERNGGTFNVYSFDLSNPEKVSQVTNYNTHPVRFLSQGADGTLAFTYDGEIYTKRGAESPKKVKISVVNDDENEVDNIAVRGGGDVAVSPDGKQLAFVARGEVFVRSIDHSSTKQVTHTPEGESDVIWGGDNRTLIYTSLRDGKYNIYKAKIVRDEDPNFSNATLIEETPLFKADGVDRNSPSLSPDGKKLAYVEDRTKLMVKDLESGKIKQLTDGSTVASRTKGFSSNWSPDSKWIAINYTELKHQPYGDVAIINVDNGELTKITATGYFDEGAKWVMDGNAILFASERYGMRNHASWGSMYDVMITFLNQDAYDRFRLSEEDYELYKEVEKSRKKAGANDKKATDKKDADKKADDKKAEQADKKDNELKFDLTNLEERTVRLTPNSSNIASAILTKDGENLYYLSAVERGYDMWKVNLRKGDVRLVNKLNAGGMDMELDKDGNIFLLGSTVKKYDPKSDRVLKDIPLSASMKLDPEKEREYMLRFVYNEEKERFYRPDLHGVKWDKMYEDYKKFLPHINNNYDFAELLSELLGELNVSHTGGRYYGPGANELTASLGLLYDLSYDGKGLKIAEVVERGPFDKADSKVKAGMIIEKINGTEIGNDADVSIALNGISRKKTLVSVYDPASGERFEEVMLPISAGALNTLLYDRWVKQRAADVDRWSNGRLGYVHIKSMDDASYRKIYSKILGEYIDRDGIVIDTRWNGGGRLHEDIEVLFSGKAYITQDVHGVETSQMPSRRWNKPSIMLICEANYSNAHGTPWVYKHLNLGKLVGMPVPGTMTSVNWVTMQDPSLVFGIPVTGMRIPDGTYLENQQLEPDIKVANDPATIVKGEDDQLRVAVETLLKDLKK